MPTPVTQTPAATPTESFFKKTLGVLRAHPPFARYMAGTTISLTGVWMQTATQGYVVSTLTDKASVLGLINLASGLPMLLLTFKGGAVADRYDKRRILLVTQSIQITLAIVMGTLVATHQVAIWHIAAIAALLGTSAAFEVPADSALVPELVDKASIRVAIAVDRALFHTTRFLGPAAAGLLIAKAGAAPAFFINALAFFALMAAVLTLAPRKIGTVEEEKKRAGGMKDGIAYVRGDKATMSMIGLLASSTLFISPIFIVMMPLYVKDVLHVGADKLGYLMSVSGIGSLTGAVGLLAIPPEKRLGRMMLASAGAAVAALGFGLAPNFYFAAASMALMSLSLSTNFGLANTIVQERAPDYLRGRVSALTGLSFFGLMPFAGMGISTLADAIGMRPAILLGGACYAVAAAAILLGPGRRASLASPPHPGPAEVVGAEDLKPDPAEASASAGQPMAQAREA